MIRLALFDIDGTLYEYRRPVETSVRDGLLSLEAQGVQIALISGRSHDYVYGFAKALGLVHAALLGENGLQITDPSIGLQNALLLPCPACVRRVTRLLEDAFPDGLELQADRASLSVRPSEAQRPEALRILREHADLNEVDLLERPNFLSLFPKGTSKGLCAQVYCARKGISPEEAIAAGDSDNDLSLRLAASTMIAVGDGIDPNEPGLLRAKTPAEMMELLLDRVSSCKK